MRHTHTHIVEVFVSGLCLLATNSGGLLFRCNCFIAGIFSCRICDVVNFCLTLFLFYSTIRSMFVFWTFFFHVMSMSRKSNIEYHFLLSSTSVDINIIYLSLSFSSPSPFPLDIYTHYIRTKLFILLLSL